MIILGYIAQDQRKAAPEGANAAGYVDEGGLIVRMTSEEWERCKEMPNLATIRIAKRLADVKRLLDQEDAEATP